MEATTVLIFCVCSTVYIRMADVNWIKRRAINGTAELISISIWTAEDVILIILAVTSIIAFCPWVRVPCKLARQELTVAPTAVLYPRVL